MSQLLGVFQAFRGRMSNLSPGRAVGSQREAGAEPSREAWRGKGGALGCQGPSACDFSRDIFYMDPIDA